MKVAVVGKGGSGKTTTSAVVARALSRAGWDVVALDCDTNSNLGISLGIGVDATERLMSLREQLDDGEIAHTPGVAELLSRFGTEAPDDVKLGVVARIDEPEPG